MSILNVTRTNATTFQVNFDRDISSWSGGSWGIEVKPGVSWTTATNLAQAGARGATFQIGGSDPAVGKPWRVLSYNTSIQFGGSVMPTPVDGVII